MHMTLHIYDVTYDITHMRPHIWRHTYDVICLTSHTWISQKVLRCGVKKACRQLILYCIEAIVFQYSPCPISHESNIALLRHGLLYIGTLSYLWKSVALDAKWRKFWIKQSANTSIETSPVITSLSGLDKELRVTKDFLCEMITHTIALHHVVV